MATYDKVCLYSEVKNISGVSKTFSFIPPHGVTLANNATHFVFGNILDVARQAGRRVEVALAAAIDAQYLEIVQLPAPIIKTPAGTPKTIAIANNGTVTATDPCFIDTSSSTVALPV